jgi:putative DNA primase/helicase
MDIRAAARALEGEISGRQILAPGPGHSREDRSLAVKLSSKPGGFVVHSFAGDDAITCRDHVRQRLGLPAFEPSRPERSRALAPERSIENGEFALCIWREATDVYGTLAESYLRGRRLELPEGDCSRFIRFHANCPFGKERHQALVSLIRNIKTDKPQAIQRTALNPADGTAVKRNGKTFRMTLGPVASGAIKIDPDEHVTLGLCVGEGLETCLAGRQIGFAPAWALLSAAVLQNFQCSPASKA